MRVRGLRESQDSNQRSHVYIGDKNGSGSTITSQVKDGSILTNYQQKQLQLLELQSQATAQSSKSIKVSAIRSQSIDKTGAGAGAAAKFNQQ